MNEQIRQQKYFTDRKRLQADTATELDALLPSILGKAFKGELSVKDAFTRRQGQYLAFTYYYAKIHGRPPAQTNIRYFFRVPPPTVHQKILDLEAKGLLARTPGEPRSLRVLLPPEELPELLPLPGPTDTRHPRGGGGIGEVAGDSRALDHLPDREARAVLRAILDRHRELTGEAQDSFDSRTIRVL